MLGLIVALGAAALVAGFTYLRREGLGAEGAGLAAEWVWRQRRGLS